MSGVWLSLLKCGVRNLVTYSILKSWHILQHYLPINREPGPLPMGFLLFWQFDVCYLFFSFLWVTPSIVSLVFVSLLLHGARCIASCFASHSCTTYAPCLCLYLAIFLVYIASFILPFSIPWWWHLYEKWIVGILNILARVRENTV